MRLRINNTILNVFEAGVENYNNARPSLVFLHYFGGSSLAWTEVIEKLAADYHSSICQTRRSIILIQTKLIRPTRLTLWARRTEPFRLPASPPTSRSRLLAVGKEVTVAGTIRETFGEQVFLLNGDKIIDELLASLQFVKRERDAGRSSWNAFWGIRQSEAKEYKTA